MTEARKKYMKGWRRAQTKSISAYQKVYYQENKKKKHEQERIRRYGLSDIEYDNLLIKQRGLCAVCNLPLKEKIMVDHNHFSRKVRGLLHFNCNLLLGHAKEDPKLLRAAAAYLEQEENATIKTIIIR